MRAGDAARRFDRALPAVLAVAAAAMMTLPAACDRGAAAAASGAATPRAAMSSASGAKTETTTETKTEAKTDKEKDRGKDRTVAPAAVLDLDGISREMRKARGHELFLHVWASWCGPCLAELPMIETFARRARARGAVVLSVSLDDVRRVAHVADVLHKKAPGLTAIVARFDDPDRFISFFSPEWEGSIPALFAYDAGGGLRHGLVGEAETEELESLLAELGAPDAGAAPRAPAPPVPSPAVHHL